MKADKYYINGLGIVSPQKTFDNGDFLTSVTGYSNNTLACIVPDFKQYIHPVQLRRLSRMLRIGLTAAIICTRESGNNKPEGIITATGYGFLDDTARFVSEMLTQQEKHLTPTFFMQGTYNALSGLVALTLKCNGYNNTYVNKGFSFETALHDAMMQLDEHRSSSMLVGAYDEAEPVQYKINSRVGHYKSEPINSLELFQHRSVGTLQGESSAFFSIETRQGTNCWCVLKAVKMIFRPDVKNLRAELLDFLQKNHVEVRDIDILVNGVSGDVKNDVLLEDLCKSFFEKIPELRFKHLCGEFCTASSFGMWMGASVLKRQMVPQGIQFNEASIPDSIKTVLVVNQYMGRNYSFILLGAG